MIARRVPPLLIRAVLVVAVAWPRLAGAGPDEATAATHARPSYALTAWSGENGEPPGDVFAIGQDVAGYLWLGTPTGLVRFDGTRFTRWPSAHGTPLPNGPVHAIVGDPDGSLWVGFGGGGGVVRIGPAATVRYNAEQGGPAGATAMIRDRHGAIWTAGRRGVFRFFDNRWTLMGASDGYPGIEASSLYEDRRGHLWVGTTSGVFRRVNGRFELVDPAANVQDLTEDSAGQVWMTHQRALAARLPGGTPPRMGPDVRLPAGGWRVLADARGQLWVAAFSGLMRIRDTAGAAPVMERFDFEHRLAGSPRALFEDRDRNIWVGMRGGLLRLSPSSFAAVPRLAGLNNDGVRTSAVGPDGSLWVATGHAINRFLGSAATAYPIPQTTALHLDREGGVWVATSQSLGRLVDGRIAALSLPDATRPARVMAITTDRRNRVWLCSAMKGVSAWDGATLQSFAGHTTVAGRACQSVYTDRRDRVWVGFLGGGVAVHENGAFRVFGGEEGLAGGTVLGILEDRGGAMWFATATGLSRYVDGRVTTITRAHAPLIDVVPVLVEDEEGAIWIGVNSGAGILRVLPAELDKVAANPAHHVEFAFFDESDGLQEGAQTWQSGVGGVRAPDGRLWVATGLGMAIIDPRNLPPPSSPTPPRIETVVVDGRRLQPGEGATLPSRTSTVGVEFSAVHLSSAAKLRFRYMLDDVDQDWVYAGNIREATYSNLPPGEHRFRVSATSTGAWTEPAVWTFAVAPPFYRMPAFLLLAGGGLVALIAASWWLRMRAIRLQYSMVFAERARVSREIHDTLLQSLAAIGVELETIATELGPAQTGPRDALRRLRREVGRAVRDARDSIRELRHNPMEQRSLAEALGALAAAARGVPVAVTVEGRPQKADVEVEIQLLRIAQEAVQNAIKHARAHQVSVTLAYEPDRILVRVADDGCGFVPDDFDPPPASGEQLGLVTMRERADRVRGRVTILSTPGVGTTVEAAIPVDGTR